MTITLNPTRDGTPRRIPKLAVRNRTSEQSACREDVTQPDHQHHDLRSVAEQQSSRDSLLHPAFRREPGSTPPTRSAVTTTRNSARDNSETESASGKVPTKRKSKGVLGFLTLKEPSTSAFEEFAEQEKKKLASQKGSNVLRGVSSQKLPEHVPKVNSKWDGLPESTKRSTAEKDSSARHSAMSFVSSRSGASDRDSVLSNGPAFPALSSRMRQSNEKHRPLTTTTATQLERVTSSLERIKHPSVEAMQSGSGEQRRSARVSEDSGSFYSFCSHPDTPPELDPSIHSSSACTPTTPDSMPRTPNLESSVTMRSKVHPQCNPWTPKVDAAPFQNSDIRDFRHASKHDDKTCTSKPHVRNNAAQRTNLAAITPNSSVASKDVAPWEAFEPPSDSAQGFPRSTTSNNSSAGYKLSQRFGAKLGLK
ncbi:hypothetical protein CKM354_000288900 [Cercospora kikuchii]|uniref:Uncharacterized protein n=1 Tax=Cercospora kikuchii TaxID=84275 RepID=A0A9P3CA58_9PEZI|nr:uncharacterized protein CKM354_000288900 [Cercospora kikuchii]GIZ39507.1 hypothetical protein CKM354_000288900 [Cercospora kikuchii]